MTGGNRRARARARFVRLPARSRPFMRVRPRFVSGHLALFIIIIIIIILETAVASELK